MSFGVFNELGWMDWFLWIMVEDVRKKFFKEVKVLIVIGGWGDIIGFLVVVFLDEIWKIFVENVVSMVRVIGVDGVDIDWEYLG